MRFEFLVLSFEFFPTHPFISDFGFRISDLPPTRPRQRVATAAGRQQLKTQNSKLKTDGIVS
jgi:hypothetical protein